MKPKIVIIILAVLLTIGVAVWYFFFHNKKKTDTSGKNQGTAQQPQINKKTVTTTVNNTTVPVQQVALPPKTVWPLKKGITSSEVATLQRFLNMKGKPLKLAPLNTDGTFSDATQAVLNKLYRLTTVSEDFYKTTVLPNAPK